MILVNLKMVFNTVDHRVPSNKLKLYGIQQRELSFFKCYLSNRTQYCSVGGYDSTVGEIEVDVAQGSFLGSLLILIYINDLPKTILGKVSMYADNTSLFHMSNDIAKLESAINEDLELLDN